MPNLKILACGGVMLLLGAVACNQSSSSSGSAPARQPKASRADPGDEPAVHVARADDESASPPRKAEQPAAEPSATEEEAPAESPAPRASAPQGAAGPEAAASDSSEVAVLPGELVGEDLTMPSVVMSNGHEEACLVKIGDALPALTLADLEGKEQTLQQLFGQKLTVVVFWNGSRDSALEELRDLTPDVAKRFGSHGVGVVAINSLDTAEAAGEAAKTAGAEFPILSDPEGQALQQLTNGKVPRTYLVDPSGKVLWLDMEYSRSTRRDLAQAIRHVLAHP